MKKLKQRENLLLILYLIVLVWIVLFKLSTNFSSLTLMHQQPSRSVNLIPFGASVIVNGKVHYQEIIYNILIFLPFGGLLGIVSKRTTFLQKILIICCSSIAIEVLQFIFSLGASDITDVINNTFGGGLGLFIYLGLKKQFSNEEKLDMVLTLTGWGIFGVLLLFILFMLVYNI